MPEKYFIHLFFSLLSISCAVLSYCGWQGREDERNSLSCKKSNSVMFRVSPIRDNFQPFSLRIFMRLRCSFLEGFNSLPSHGMSQHIKLISDIVETTLQSWIYFLHITTIIVVSLNLSLLNDVCDRKNNWIFASRQSQSNFPFPAPELKKRVQCACAAKKKSNFLFMSAEAC